MSRGERSKALVEKFSSSYYGLERQGDYVLRVQLDSSYPYIHRKYDFLGRMLFVSSAHSETTIVAIPFSELDRESLEFFRAQLIEKGGNPPPLPEALPKEASEAWVRMGTKAVAHVGVYPETGRKLTDIFNFESRQHVLITENLKTGAEISSQPASFDTLQTATLEKAVEEFTRAGGEVDKSFVLRGVIQLKK